MQAAYLLGGGKMHYKKYTINATQTVGTIVLRGDNSTSGLVVSTTTSWADSVGLVMDLGSFQGATTPYSVVQGDPLGMHTILINDDAIYRALMVGSATNAILADNAIVTASSNGLTAVGTNSVSNLDGGLVWYTSGPNVGSWRKITSISSATATVVVPFAANAVGDVFLACSGAISLEGYTMGTDLTNNLQSNTALTGVTGTCVDFELLGNSNSYLHLKQQDSTFAGTT